MAKLEVFVAIKMTRFLTIFNLSTKISEKAQLKTIRMNLINVIQASIQTNLKHGTLPIFILITYKKILCIALEGGGVSNHEEHYWIQTLQGSFNL